ncbi:MAG: hypothetical protein IMZ44_07385 [Planctomycetes bacterium]|nr:hypothetical protein [Planctomycetota bacterium]
MVFAYKKSKNEGYRIYEMNLDGTGLRQLTFDAPEEAHLMARYGQRFRYEDCDPIYLPNDKIMFASTRPQRRVFCFGSTVTSLYVMDADDGNPCCISEGPVNEMSPCVLDNGQVIYTRWEYVDKGFGNVQSLWSMYPDGSHSAHVYKSDLVLPAGMVNARGIPGSSRIVTIGAPHCGLSVGPVVLVENSIDRRTPGGMTNLTPELGYPGMSPHRSGQTFGYFKEPYPLSEKCFLVSYNPRARDSEPAGYGIYVLDAWGNREELHRDPSMSCFQPTPLRPRRKPTVIPPVAEQGETEEKALGTLFMQDVYEGVTGIPRGRVRYLRVTEALGVSWDDGWRSGQQDDGAGLQASAVSLRCDVNIKKIHGIATVHEDGSAHFTVPAGKNLFFQALDENYMELQRMRTFVNLMPGEKRSCIGCHEHRTSAPPLKSAQPTALSRPAETLRPQPGDTGPRRVHYALDIRPILDKHCVGCHGSQEPPGDLDLDETLYYCNDANMNVTALVNASGAVVERYAYDPYGKVTILDGTTGGQTEWAADDNQKSDVDNEILYCGYRFDPESGLYHVRHRYYHPTLGRWVGRDPFGNGRPASLPTRQAFMRVAEALAVSWRQANREAQNEVFDYPDGMSLYQYVAGQPGRRLDPSGLASHCCGPEVTELLDKMLQDIDTRWAGMDDADKQRTCTRLWDRKGTPTQWDIQEFSSMPRGGALPTVNMPGFCEGPCPSQDDTECRTTVTVHGKCYDTGQVNYILWGKLNGLCGTWRVTTYTFVILYKVPNIALSGFSPHHVPEALGLTAVGYSGDLENGKNIGSQHEQCKVAGCKSKLEKLEYWPKPYHAKSAP